MSNLNRKSSPSIPEARFTYKNWDGKKFCLMFRDSEWKKKCAWLILHNSCADCNWMQGLSDSWNVL